MPAVTLFAKAHSNFRPAKFNEALKSMLEGLEVEINTHGATERRWINVEVSGPDENVALHLLDEKIGLCPIGQDAVQRFSTVRGRVYGAARSRNELHIDFGISIPKIIDATVSLSKLQGQLADGRNVSLEEIVRLFGLCEDIPFTVKIDSIGMEGGLAAAEVAEEQRMIYAKWIESLLDRLFVLGSSFNGIETTLKATGLKRDIVCIEPLGGFEFAIVCKLGTDAVGLIPKIGRSLRNARFTVFSPRKILSFFGNETPIFL